MLVPHGDFSNSLMSIKSFQCKIGRWRPLNIRDFTVDARAQFRARNEYKTKQTKQNRTTTHLSELVLTWAL
jgi:hypothetical protein